MQVCLRSTTCRDSSHFDPNFLRIFCALLIQQDPTSFIVLTLVAVATLPLVCFPACFVAKICNLQWVPCVCTWFYMHFRQKYCFRTQILCTLDMHGFYSQINLSSMFTLACFHPGISFVSTFHSQIFTSPPITQYSYSIKLRDHERHA